jgi:hypothetical protein
VRTERIKALVTHLGPQKLILGLPWISRNRLNFDWDTSQILFADPRSLSHQIYVENVDNDTEYEPDPEPNPEPDNDIPDSSITRLDIYAISARSFDWLARRRCHELFAVSLQDINKALEEKVPTDPRTKLPPEYHEFLDVFSRKEADRLPPHRTYDHKIKITKKEGHGFGPLYGMSRNELLVLKKFLEENLSRGFIRAS